MLFPIYADKCSEKYNFMNLPWQLNKLLEIGINREQMLQVKQLQVTKICEIAYSS